MPFVKAAASFVTLKRYPTVFPPIVKVICGVPRWRSPSSVLGVDRPRCDTLIVVRFVVSLFVTEKLPTLTAHPNAPGSILREGVEGNALPVFVRTAPLFTVRMLARSPSTRL